jgi:hypothetical protein
MLLTLTRRSGFAALGLSLSLTSGTWAQAPAPASRPDPARPRPAAAQVQPAPAPPVATAPEVPGPDADQVRDQLRQTLDRVPPSVREVLQLEPSLMTNPDYLAPYPDLANYIARHPEIARNPAYYVGTPHDDNWSKDPVRISMNMWQDVMQGLFILTLFLVVIGALTWLIRTLIDYRRWLRLSRVQTETHTKLLDRLTSNEDLLAYMQTAAGRRFLELAPISLDAASRPLGAPLNRILWSVQAGIVLALAGIGLQIISRQTAAELAGPVMAIAVLAMAIGVGFVVSAVVAWLLSKRLGLLEPRNQPTDVAESSVTR